MKRIITIVLTVALLLATCLTMASCASAEYCEYYYNRDNSGRNMFYVKMTVEEHGDIILALDGTAAPLTVMNFVGLVDDGFYNGLTFHRVKKNFMIQGGDPQANGQGGSGTTITGEFSSNGDTGNDLTHKRGVISMARGDDPDSASSQFFICNADSEFLDGDYAAFGYVLYGMSTVDSIADASLPFANSASGTISKKENQAKILKAEVITQAEAYAYISIP